MPRRTAWILLSLFVLSACTKSVRKNQGSLPTPLHYEVNLLDRADDLFKVTLKVSDLTSENAVYQFAATAPGTYQVMDLGRFVRSFQALDEDGVQIPTENISTNQWKISNPENVREIRYSIAETWDTPVDSNKIFLMAGTSIEDDHVQLMGHCVFGYPTGMQDRALKIKLNYPDSWKVGTALNKRNGFYLAEDYDHIVDSPILLGRLSKADLKVHGRQIEIYTYSKTDQIQSKDILEVTKDVLLSAAKFLNGLPVDRYTFLFFFEDQTQGAWEHSYSSNYVYREVPLEQLPRLGLPDVVAHEFFHIVTPFNIHSEIIEQFNFVEPVPSEHLWLYEGTTEWAAHAMQLRSGLVTLEDYLKSVGRKLRADDNFRKDYSLRDLAMKSFSPEGQSQYGSIYMRGALVAGLLDIRLLELSGGKRGLREVVNELSKIYGPDKAFPEREFYSIFTERTHPEIEEFFESYIRQASPLPIDEYYGKLGIKYIPEVHTGEEITSGGFRVNGSADGRFFLSQVHQKVKQFGLRDGDTILKYNGEPVTLQNIRAIFTEFQQMEAGIPYEIVVGRNGEEVALQCEKITRERIDKHIFEIDENATPEQLRLREVWMRNI